MLRRSLVVLAGLVLAATLVTPALAVRVHVRVEGKTQTIFGPTEPTLTVKDTVLDSIESASLAGEFFYHATTGGYVDQIGRYPAGGLSSGWAFKVNGILSPVSARALHLHDGDVVLWYWATFNGPAGPPTLSLETSAPGEVKGKTCFYAVAQNDAGRRLRTANVVYALNGRRVASASGVLCTKARHYTVRITKAGAVRSPAYVR